MHYSVVADTEIGRVKQSNQDSYLIKQGCYRDTEILLVVLCDGMGGLAKGELASAEVVRRFADWFQAQSTREAEFFQEQCIMNQWRELLRDSNDKLFCYGGSYGARLGTTCTAVLFIGKRYVCAHIGDCRLYEITMDRIKSLTTDHSFVAQAVQQGWLTPEQAKTDRRRSMLLRCVGASTDVEPDLFVGEVQDGVYLLCSDGLYHENTEEDFMRELQPRRPLERDAMRQKLRGMIQHAVEQGERDNITAIAIQAMS